MNHRKNTTKNHIKQNQDAVLLSGLALQGLDHGLAEKLKLAIQIHRKHWVIQRICLLYKLYNLYKPCYNHL